MRIARPDLWHPRNRTEGANVSSGSAQLYLNHSNGRWSLRRVAMLSLASGFCN